MKRKGLLLAGAFTALAAGAYLGIGNYFYNYALKAKRRKEFLEDNPHLAQSETIDYAREGLEQQADQEFIAKHRPKRRAIQTRDRLELILHADVYEHEQAGSKWVIAVHGYTGRAAEMIRWVRGFHQKGFHVLAPDLRGHGESEGDYIGMGWHDRLDLLAWIDDIIDKDPDAEIVLFGLSMGAATVMMTAGEELPPNVKVIVEDCGFSSVSEVFTHQLDDIFGLPEIPAIPAANTITKLRAGYDIYQASAVKQVEKSKTPMLFIHGDRDNFVPFKMQDQLYRAANVEKEKLVIHGAGHGEAVRVRPDLYWDTVWQFVGRFIHL